jgi:hypothetical protein
MKKCWPLKLHMLELWEQLSPVPFHRKPPETPNEEGGTRKAFLGVSNGMPLPQQSLDSFQDIPRLPWMTAVSYWIPSRSYKS